MDETGLIDGFGKGTAFSRAAKRTKTKPALAAEGLLPYRQTVLPQLVDRTYITNGA